MRAPSAVRASSHGRAVGRVLAHLLDVRREDLRAQRLHAGPQRLAVLPRGAGSLQQLGGALAGIEALRPVLGAAGLLVVVGGVPEVVHLLAEDLRGGQHPVGRAGAGLLQPRGLLLDALPHLGVRGEPAGSGREQRERPLRGPERRTGPSGARNQLLPGHGCSFGSRGRAQQRLPCRHDIGRPGTASAGVGTVHPTSGSISSHIGWLICSLNVRVRWWLSRNTAVLPITVGQVSALQKYRVKSTPCTSSPASSIAASSAASRFSRNASSRGTAQAEASSRCIERHLSGLRRWQGTSRSTATRGPSISSRVAASPSCHSVLASVSGTSSSRPGLLNMASSPRSGCSSAIRCSSPSRHWVQESQGSSRSFCGISSGRQESLLLLSRRTFPCSASRSSAGSQLAAWESPTRNTSGASGSSPTWHPSGLESVWSLWHPASYTEGLSSATESRPGARLAGTYSVPTGSSSCTEPGASRCLVSGCFAPASDTPPEPTTTASEAPTATSPVSRCRCSCSRRHPITGRSTKRCSSQASGTAAAPSASVCARGRGASEKVTA